jgi:hypothetical protein
MFAGKTQALSSSKLSYFFALLFPVVSKVHLERMNMRHLLVDFEIVFWCSGKERAVHIIKPLTIKVRS